LVQAKEELLKLSRTNVNTLDSVKSHIDVLVKVRNSLSLAISHLANMCLQKTASDIQKKVDELVQPLPASDSSTSMVIG
jgi:THO complex subunit 5